MLEGQCNIDCIYRMEAHVGYGVGMSQYTVDSLSHPTPPPPPSPLPVPLFLLSTSTVRVVTTPLSVCCL